MFDSSSLPTADMQVDEPAASASQAQPRDIARGAIVRERKKRDKLRDWQVANQVSKATTVDEGEDDGGDAADSDEEDDGEGGGYNDSVQDSPGFSESVKQLIVSY